MAKLLFESGTCSRCCGSGEYSYCRDYGTRCFKCAGLGVALTKRGRIAQHWFNEKKKKPAGELKPGEKMVFEGVPGYSRSRVVTVSAVGYREDGNKYKDSVTGEWKSYFVVEGVDATGETATLHGFENTTVKMHVEGEALVALKAAAKAYEATLTKAGTVRKKEKVK